MSDRVCALCENPDHPGRNCNTPGRAYRTIVADPPWPYQDRNAAWVKRNGGRLLPYESMGLDEIAALPVKEWSDNRGQDAHLYLWTTSRYLRDSFDISRSWGFHYSATLVWCKASRGFGVGGSFQNNVEFVLFCRRPGVTPRPGVLRLTERLADAAERAGVTRAEVDEHMGTSDMAGWWLSRQSHRCACPTDEQWPRLKALLGVDDDGLDVLVAELNVRKGTDRKETPQAARSRWFTWPRGTHSQKPEAFLDLVEQVSPGPYLELFARRDRLGWDTWGNESLGTAELVA